MSFGTQTRSFFGSRHWATAAAVPLLVAAAAMPRVTLPRDTFSYVVTFDITQSMDVEDAVLDGAPVSRLAFARTTMRDVLGRLPCGAKVGWSVFTGQRTLLLLPPVDVCENYDALLSSLDRIDGRMRWTNWSRIAEGGIYSAVRVAHDVGRGAAVVFFTDGQEAPPLLSTDVTKRDINRVHVGGWLIGVGGDQAAPIPRTDADGNRHGYWQAEDVIQVPAQQGSATPAESHEERSALQGRYLASVAEQIGFGYRRLSSAASLRDAMLDERFAHREPTPTDLRWAPALCALLLLVWRFLPAFGVVRCRTGARNLLTSIYRLLT
ncbi:MxaL protein [Burkholderia anthina]|uniref:MxaL protein n=1 Tax=Burkholderia anthina TaxID=179879 RepID=A0A6P2G6F1_9BURK|nr:hypothetical protein BAN20980_01615 [Burkholderia anthina]